MRGHMDARPSHGIACTSDYRLAHRPDQFTILNFNDFVQGDESLCHSNHTLCANTLAAQSMSYIPERCRLALKSDHLVSSMHIIMQAFKCPM